MPYSTDGIHVDAILSNFAIQYRQDSGIYIADRVSPPVKVKKESDKYKVYEQKDRFTLPFMKRGDGTKAKIIDWALATDGSYVCEAYALKDKVTDRAKQNADSPPLNLERDTNDFLTDLIMLDREYRVASAIFNTTTFTSYTAALTGADRWDQYEESASDPIADVETGKDSVMTNAQIVPNTVIMGYDVYRYVRHHPVVLDRIKGGATKTNIATVSEQQLAEVFDVDQVLVGRAIYNSANKGQTASYARAWGKYVMICYVKPNPTNTKGVTVSYSPMSQDMQVKKWYDQEIDSTWVQVEQIIDEVVPCAACGYLFSTVVS